MFRQRCRTPLGGPRDEDGFTLIELMVAIFVIGVGLMALASVSITSIRSLRISRERQDAVQLASSVLEDARASDYGRVALDLDEPGVSLLADYEGESVVAVQDGQVAHSWTSADGHRVTSWVTQISVDEKRVTTIVEWDDAGSTRQVVEQTRVAEAERGLPVPNFQLSPETAGQEGVRGEVICFDHTLTNLGESDSYSWQLFRYDGSGNLVTATSETRTVESDGTVEGFKVSGSGPGKGWFAWAKMGTNNSTLDPMTDQTADGRPDSASPVPRRAEHVIRICYTPKENGVIASDLDETPTFVVRVYSTFDPTVVREVENRLTVISATRAYHLHHLYGNNGSPKAPQQHGYQLVMDPGPPTQSDPSVNFDPTSGSNSDPYPGLKLGAGSTVIFDYQNIDGTSRTITADSGRIRAFASTQEAMQGTDDVLDLELSLHHFRASTGTETDLTPVIEATQPVSSGSFTLIDVQPPMNGVVLEPNDYLRLRIHCPADDNPNGCHLAYDVDPQFPSSVSVEIQ